MVFPPPSERLSLLHRSVCLSSSIGASVSLEVSEPAVTRLFVSWFCFVLFAGTCKYGGQGGVIKG